MRHTLKKIDQKLRDMKDAEFQMLLRKEQKDAQRILIRLWKEVHEK